MKYEDYDGKAWYALRRTLPPWSWKDNLIELVELCPKYCIDEVIVKVDTEEFSHHILPIDWLQKYQSALFKIKRQLNEIGVVFSINPWVTLVHGDRARNCQAQYPEMDFMVGHDGAQCTDCACPLSQGWRDHTAKLWRIYAETAPDTIWVEDDIRTFNHNPVDYGCFCDAHIKIFGERINKKNVTREKIVESILHPGSPHMYRKEWMEMQGDIMVDVARILSEAVHEVSPCTKVGLMSSEPQAHAMEGRKWDEFTKALAGTTDVVSRPGNGSYTEFHLTDLYYTTNCIRLTRHARAAPAIELVEIENFPYSQYAKSAQFTFLQSVASIVMGCQGMAFNLFDHDGSPMANDIETLSLLRDEKPYLEALARQTDASGIFSGIGLLHHNQSSQSKYLDPDSTYADLMPEDDRWEDQLQGLGFATTYSPSSVIALSGQGIRNLEQDQILKLLSQGVLCDLSAATILQQMGYGEHLGVEIMETYRRDEIPIAAEHLYHKNFGGQHQKYVPLTIHHGEMLFAKCMADPNSIEISEIVGPQIDRLYQGVTLYENTLGGRVAVYPYQISKMLYRRFLSPYRQEQLQHVLDWLSRSAIPLKVIGGHNALPIRLDMPSHSIIAVFCLSLDPWRQVTLDVVEKNRSIKIIQKLEDNGEWLPYKNYKLQGDRIQLQCEQIITFHRPVIFRIEWR